MRRSKSETSAAFRDEVAEWIRDLHRRSGLAYDVIAQRAGVSSSTLYRWMDAKRTDTPSHSALSSLSEAFGVAVPGYKPTVRPSGGLAEQGAAPIEPPEQELSLTANQSWWRVRDRAIELAGYLPGDRLLLDQSIKPRRGDAVVAQIFDIERGSAQTVIRIFVFPVLITKSADPSWSDRADFIDNERVSVVGPIIRLIRDLSR